MQVSESRIIQMHDFLLDIGDLEEPLFTEEDRVSIAELEAKGAFEDPSRYFDFLTTEENAPDVPLDSEWLREPISPEEFLVDPYYGGPQAGALFPILQEEFIEIFTKDIHEVLLGGCIGYGKTYFMAWAMFRQLYELSCLREPQKFLGIAPDTPVVMVNLSVTGLQAKNACFNYVKTLVDSSPYFMEHFARDDKVNSALQFPRNILYQPGSSSEFSAIGTNLIAGAVDEANFLVSAKKAAHERLQAQDVDHAMVLYRALSRRIESRFKFSRGWKGRLFLASSRVYDGDFIDQQIKQKQGRPGVKILDYAHWDVRGFEEGKEVRDKRTGEVLYSGDVFEVAIGKAGENSRILEGDEHVADDTVVIRIPVEYRDSFETDLDGSIRDIAGRATLSVNPWITKRKAISDQAVEEFDGLPLVHPLPDDTHKGIVCTDELADQLNVEVLCDHTIHWEGYGSKRHRVEILKPKRAPDEMRYIHVDLAATNDAAGFAMGYVAGSKMTKVREGRSNRVESREVPIIVFELVAGIVAPVGGEIEFSYIREMIYRLRDEMNFQIASVTFDQWQSRDSRQILKARGFNCEEISVDRDIGPYSVLRNGIMAGWIYYYPHHALLRELRKVQRVVKPSGRIKVDHPVYDMDNPRTGKGSKDVADAMTAVCSVIMENYKSHGDVAVPTASSPKPPDPIGAHVWKDPQNSWLISDYMRKDAERYHRQQEAKQRMGEDPAK